LCDTLSFDAHIGNVLKMCSVRIYLLKLLRYQGLPRHHMNTVFGALVLSRIWYAIPAWSGFYNAAAMLAMQSAVIPTAIPSVRPSVCHTLVPYPDE